jgi:hypothetical protein
MPADKKTIAIADDSFTGFFMVHLCCERDGLRLSARNIVEEPPVVHAMFMAGNNHSEIEAFLPETLETTRVGHTPMFVACCGGRRWLM